MSTEISTAYSNSDLFFVEDGREYISLMNGVLDDIFGTSKKEKFAYFSLNDKKYRYAYSFDTTANCFPEGFYRSFTSLKKVKFFASFKSKRWQISILRRSNNQEPDLLFLKNGKNKCDVSLDIPMRSGDSRLYFEIRFDDNLSIERISWCAEKPESCRPIGLSITTYNKKDYIVRNIASVKKSAAARHSLLTMMVVNNGEPFDCESDDVDITILPNVGGTGGFREAYQRFAREGYEHFIIMDDDISFDPETVDRLYAISCFSGSRHVGALAEIQNTAPRLIKEQGGMVATNNVFGLNLQNHLVDISTAERAALYRPREVHFSGWWCLLVALNAGLDLPPKGLFIKRDDIMFGFESARLGHATVVFPNILISHSEEGAPAYYYYDIRNDLIMRARNADALGTSVAQLIKLSVALFLKLHHEKQRLFNLALADFMRGPHSIENADLPRKLSQVRTMSPKLASLDDTVRPIPRSGNFGSVLKSAASFLNPRNYGAPKNEDLYLIDEDQAYNTNGISSYLETVPYTGKFYKWTRHPSAVIDLFRSLFLILLFRLRRNSLYRRYKDQRNAGT